MPKRRHAGLFKPGAQNPAHRTRRPQTGAGRKKGTPNKFSRDIKTAILNALEKLGGDEWFVKLGKNAKTRGNMASLVGKLLPLQIEGAGPGTPEEQADKIRQRLSMINEVTSHKPKE